ncbi:unnamed protein product, partial [Prorocentrum cordatum]
VLFNEAAAQRCLAYLFEKAGCLQHVDEVRTNSEHTNKPCGLYRIRVHVKSTVSRDVTWECRKVWMQCFQNGRIFAQDQDVRVYKRIVQCRVSIPVECSPWKQPHVAAAGRFNACFYKHSILVDGCVRIESYGPPTTFVWAYPSLQYTDGACVASFRTDRTDQWLLDETALLRIDSTFKLAEFK